MKKASEVQEKVSEKHIGSYLLVIDGIFLSILGVLPILGFKIPAITLSGSIGNSLNNWLIFVFDNIADVLIGIFTDYKWQYLLDFISFSLIFVSFILFFISGIVTFSKRSKIGLFGAICFTIAIIMIITVPFLVNEILQFPIPSNYASILLVIDTNIIIVMVLGFLGGLFTYFQKEEEME